MAGEKRVYVLDASALIHSNTMQIYDRQCYITPSVADEVLDPVVITDDYSIMNVLTRLGIGYETIRFRRPREFREWLVYCPACGATYRQNLKQCPRCGHPFLKRKPRRRVRGEGVVGRRHK